jgi:hypothetical protein
MLDPKVRMPMRGASLQMGYFQDSFQRLFEAFGGEFPVS